MRMTSLSKSYLRAAGAGGTEASETHPFRPKRVLIAKNCGKMHVVAGARPTVCGDRACSSSELK